MRVRLLLALVAAIACSLTPARASATNVRFGLGAHYWLVERGVFDIEIQIDVPIASFIAVGGRFGVLATSGPTRVGLPLDLVARFRITGPVYLEVLGGPWIFFGDGQALHAHFAVGIGLTVGSVSFGPEVGYLEPDGIVGMKLSFRF